jgi:transposase
MTDDDLSFLPLKVTKVGPRGKRTFDPDGKRRLVEACRHPGVSISGMALKAGVNVNQLHKWIRDDEREGAVDGTGGAECVVPSFVPVVTLGEVGGQPIEALAEAAPVVARREPAAPALRAPVPARLLAQLPNGVTLELECGGRDGALVKAMIEALGTR